MNFVSNPLKLYIHMIFIMIYLQMKCFQNFPTLKNVEFFEIYLKFKKTLKFGLFLQ